MISTGVTPPRGRTPASLAASIDLGPSNLRQHVPFVSASPAERDRVPGWPPNFGNCNGGSYYI